MKALGNRRPAGRGCPSHQRLDADERCRQVEDRLIVKEELVGCERLA